MKITLLLNRRKSGAVFALALMTVLGARPSLATDYSWFAPGKGLAAGGWSGGLNWLPRTPGAGGPTAADNVIPSTALGDIRVDIPNAEVTNWTSFLNGNQVVNALSGETNNVSLTISGTLAKFGTGALTFRRLANDFNVSVGTVSLSAGSLLMGDDTIELSTFSAGSVDISGGSMYFNVEGSASITNLVTISGSGALYLARLPGTTRSVSIGALSSASATALVSNESATTSTLHLTAMNDAEAYYAGIIRGGAGFTPGVLAVVKDGDGMQIFSGNSNTYNGGTTINAGTLLINNTSGSGTGTGGVRITGGELGGTGILAPTGSDGIIVTAHGNIVPGDPMGALTFDMSGTTGTVQSGGGFGFELGPANSLIGSIAAGSSGLLVISGASPGDVSFSNTGINLFGSANGEGYYKLFATSAGAATWIGLTLGEASTGGHFITEGLTASNFGHGYSGFLILGDGSAGTSPGDIYLVVIPEPSTFALLAATGLLSLITIRTRRRS
jgi:autotransporter-associated beta strand protein